MTLTGALLSHYRRHPLQLAALALMILLATMLWSGVHQLTGQARDSLARAEQSLSGGREAVRSDGQPVTVDDFVRLRRAGVCVMPWLEVPDPDGPGRLVGIDPLAGQCLVSDSHSGRAPALDGDPFVDIHRAATVSAATPVDSPLHLIVGESPGPLPPGYESAPFQRGPDTGELGRSFLLNLDALGALVLMITALLLRAVYRLGQAQRETSFVLLARYGVPDRVIRRRLVLEILLLSALCIGPGVWAGSALARLLGNGFGASLEGLFDLPLYAGGTDWLTPALVMTAVVVLACVSDLLVPARCRAWLDRGGRSLWPGVILAAVGGAAVLVVSGLAATFAAVAVVFAGVGLLVPTVLSRLADRLAARGVDELRRWRWRELGVMARRLALPVVALQFTLALVLAVQALVASFEQTFEGWLDQRLAADWYLDVPAGADAGPAADWLAGQLAGVDGAAWHRIRRGSATVARIGADDGTRASHRLDLLAVAPIGPLLTRWHLLASADRPWDALARGDGVMINEQAARRFGWVTGDRLRLGEAAAGAATDGLPVLGVYADYGRPEGEVLVAGSRWPAGQTPSFEGFAIEPGTADIDRLIDGVTRRWGGEAPEVQENRAIRASANAVFQRTFVLTRAMTLLTLVLAGTALLVMGLVFITSRAWYFRLLRAWGLSGRAVFSQLLRLCLGLTLGVALLALPLGIWLTWVLVGRINPEAFGWSLPMAVYPGFWLELLVLSALIGLGIAGLMRRSLAREATS